MQGARGIAAALLRHPRTCADVIAALSPRTPCHPRGRLASLPSMSRYTLIIGNQNYSSWSLRPWLLLEHFGLDYQTQKIWLDKDNSAQELATASSSKRVPVLLDQQIPAQPIWDSMAIAEHLVHEHPEHKMWPEQSKARAFARSASAEMHSSFFALRSQMPMNCKRRGIDVGPDAACQADLARVYELWCYGREQFCAQGLFLAGPFSILDAMFAPVVWRLTSYVEDLRKPVAEYCDQMRQLPAMQKWEQEALAESECLPSCDELGRPRS